MRALWSRIPDVSVVKVNAALNLTQQVVYRASGIAVLAALSRSVPAADLGAYFFAEATSLLLAAMTGLGLGPPLVRRAAAEPARAGHWMAAALGARLAVAPLYLVLAVAVPWALGYVSPAIALGVALAVLLEDVSFMLGGMFYASRRVGRYVLIGTVTQVLFVAGLLVGLQWEPGLGVLVVASLLRSALLLGGAAVVIHYTIAPLRVAWDAALVREGGPFVAIAGLNMARERSDAVLLGLLSTAVAVANYQLAFRLVSAATFLPQVLGTTLFPELAAWGAVSGNRIRFRIAVAGLLAAGVAGAAVLMAAAWPICQVLYGPQAAEVVPLAQALALLLPLLFVDLLAQQCLQALGRERPVVRAMVVGLGAGVASAAVLIPFVGPYGVVAGQFVASLARLVAGVVELGRAGLLRSPRVADPPRAAVAENHHANV